MIDVVMPIYASVEPECFVSVVRMMSAIGKANFILGIRQSDVVEVRNMLAEQAAKSGNSFSLWIDSDVSFKHIDVVRLMEVMGQRDVAVASGVYRMRRPPHARCAWKWYSGAEGNGYVEAVGVGVEEVDAVGAGFMLVRNSVFKEVGVSFHKEDGYSEDISFCRRVRRVGMKVCVHHDVNCGHVMTQVLEV